MNWKRILITDLRKLQLDHSAYNVCQTPSHNLLVHSLVSHSCFIWRQYLYILKLHTFLWGVNRHRWLGSYHGSSHSKFIVILATCVSEHTSRNGINLWVWSDYVIDQSMISIAFLLWRKYQVKPSIIHGILHIQYLPTEVKYLK